MTTREKMNVLCEQKLSNLSDADIRALFFYLTGYCQDNKEFVNGIGSGLAQIGVAQ